MSRLDPGGPYKRPSLLPWITALRVTSPEHDWVRPTDEEDDIAAVLESVHGEHRSEAEAPDNNEWVSPWGTCVVCADRWPCSSWLEADQLGRLWLGRAHDRYVDRVRPVMTKRKGTAA